MSNKRIKTNDILVSGVIQKYQVMRREGDKVTLQCVKFGSKKVTRPVKTEIDGTEFVTIDGHWFFVCM